MNRNNNSKQNVKYSLANYQWLTTCFIEIKVDWQLLDVSGCLLVYWGESKQCEEHKFQVSSTLALGGSRVCITP